MDFIPAKEVMVRRKTPDAAGALPMASPSLANSHLSLKRVYDPALAEDGYRILIDRLWPRGVSKERAALDEWMKEIAPSADLRKWFGHDPGRWREFQRRYRAELRSHTEELDHIRHVAKARHVTLVYGAQDEQHNDAVVLKNVLLGDDNRES